MFLEYIIDNQRYGQKYCGLTSVPKTVNLIQSPHSDHMKISNSFLHLQFNTNRNENIEISSNYRRMYMYQFFM